MNIKHKYIIILLLACSLTAYAQESSTTAEDAFARAADSIQLQLEKSVSDLNELREQIAQEKVSLNRKLSELEQELSTVRLKYQETTRLLDSRTLDMSNLRNEIKSRHQEATYLSNLLGEYIRNFESRLHIAEVQRYRKPLETAMLALENNNLSEQELYKAQADLLEASLERLHEAMGGERFDGTAVDTDGKVKRGTFVLIGPSALFRSEDGSIIGTVEQRLGSLEPSVVPFNDIADTSAANHLISDSTGLFPLDPTLGNAHKIEDTRESLVDHIKKGGPVMYPIFALAGAAFLVAFFKWLSMVFIRTPSQKRINALLDNVAQRDARAAEQKVRTIKGPVGKMLTVGIAHLKEPRELIEEVMYEKVMATRLKLQRFLPFIAISAASAPLLGLLGTVTGIINTFKLITVFGSGDVKTLSGGISEALITTEFGLIVAIPSLLLHAFLSRKARGVVNQMEKAAVALINQIGKTPYRKDKTTELLEEMPQAVAREVLAGLNNHEEQRQATHEFLLNPDNTVGNIMDRRVISVDKSDTVAEAICKIRAGKDDEELPIIFVVDEQGKYVGDLRVRLLLSRPEQAPIESLVNTESLFVRVDTDQEELQGLFSDYDLITIPVLDHEDRLVGRINRNGRK